MMRMAAIYARVSSEQQREENTIASQAASLIEFAKSHDLEVPGEWVCEDEGYSGATLERPGLERVRDLAAEGQIQVMLAYSPDRLSRKYAYQILLIEEFARHGVETVFVKSPQGIPTRKASAALATLDRLGGAAQLRVSQCRLLRQDPHLCTDAGYAPTASAGCNHAQHHSRPRNARAKSGSRSPCRPW